MSDTLKEDNPILRNAEIQKLFDWIYCKGNIPGEEINQLYEKFIIGRRQGK